jgi:GTPase
MLELMVSALLTIYSQFHTCRPDSRVIKLIKRLGTKVNPNQRRILCMNKVDLVEDKKDLLKVAKEFESLPAYERLSLVCRLSLCSYYFICFI